jgi:hypothetical protein
MSAGSRRVDIESDETLLALVLAGRIGRFDEK